MADTVTVQPSAIMPCGATVGFDNAVARLEQSAFPLGCDQLPLRAALGHVLAAPVFSRLDSPRVDVAAMDGYAVDHADLVASSARLAVAGEAIPGQPSPAIAGRGKAVRVFTGAPMPEGADRVIVQEIVERAGDCITLREAPGNRRHVRSRGSDFRAGDMLLPAGRMLDPRAIMAAAAADCANLTVWRRPRLFLMATGDELVSAGFASAAAMAVPDSLSVAVAGLAKQWGASCIGNKPVPDAPRQIEQVAGEAVENADILVVTGGASVGERDFSLSVLTSLGMEKIFAKVAMKPGKPVWYGRLGRTHVLGLPGNPVAAMVTARLFLAPLICRLAGRFASAALAWRTVALGSPITDYCARERFICAAWDGEKVVAPGRQWGWSQHILAMANALIRLQPGQAPIAAGSPVEMLDF